MRAQKAVTPHCVRLLTGIGITALEYKYNYDYSFIN